MSSLSSPHDIISRLRTQDADAHLVVLLSPVKARAALASLFSFDAELATAAAASPEVMVNCIRLAWWREQVEALDTPAVSLPAPLLEAMRAYILPRGIRATELAALEAPWADILEQDKAASDSDLAAWCCARGGALFDLASRIIAPEAPDAARQHLHQWGHIWALAQWLRGGAVTFSPPQPPAALALPPALRPLAALGRLSLRDIQRVHRQPDMRPPRKGSPGRLLHLLFSSLRKR